jgi:hypothetical protein
MYGQLAATTCCLLLTTAAMLALPTPALATRTVFHERGYECELNMELWPDGRSLSKVYCRRTYAPTTDWHVCFMETTGPLSRQNCVGPGDQVLVNDEPRLYSSSSSVI